jgi:hypothetical protein
MKKLAPVLVPFCVLCAMTAAASAAEYAADESLLSGSGGKFLISQLFTILASAFGIYFASYVSFQRSLKHSKLVKAQQTSALLTATRQELTGNIGRMRKFEERLPGESGYGLSNEEWPALRLFVWHAAGRSSAAFDLPPEILNGIQGFYEDLGVMLQDGAARENFRRLTTSNTWERTQYKERLNALLSGVETELLPALDKTVAEAQGTVGKLSS